MIKQFLHFIRVFGQGKKKQLFLLFAGSILGGLIEIIGVALIFSFITIVTDKNDSSNSILYRFAIDYLGFESKKSILILSVISICSVYLVKSIYSTVFQIFQLRLVRDFKNTIAKSLMDLYLKAPMSYFSKTHSMAIVTNIRSTLIYIVYFFLLSAIVFWSNLMVVFGLGIYLLYFNYSIMVPTLVFVGLFALIHHKIIKSKSHEAGSRYTKNNQDVYRAIRNNVGSAADIKILNQEKYFADKFNEANERLSSSDFEIEFFKAVPVTLNDGFIALSTILIFFTIYLLTSFDQIIPIFGTLIAVIVRIAAPFNNLIRLKVQIDSSRGAVDQFLADYEKLREIAEDEIDESKVIQMKNKISLRDIKFQYDKGSKFVLDIETLDVNKGEFIGIVGKSGSGKSTLVNIISGLIAPHSGHLIIDDTKIDAIDYIQLRGNVSLVLQDAQVIDESLEENILFGRKNIESSMIDDVINITGLDKLVRSKENGVKFILGEDGVNISGGERQRVAIARALISNSEIIFFDEATSNLDNESVAVFGEMIQRLKGKKTLLSVTHNIKTLKHCDKIVVIEDGKIRAEGRYEELIKNSIFVEQLEKGYNIN